MKLCWENLDRLYLTRNGNLRVRGGNAYVYKESCKNCYKPFLATYEVTGGKVKIGDFCNVRCSMCGKNNPNFGKPLLIQTKQKLSKTNSGENHSNWRGGVKRLGIPLYDTYGCGLLIFEEVRIYMLRIGCTVYKTFQVRCHNSGCRKWFRPTTTQVECRLVVFNGVGGANNFYCSEECKSTCSTYKQISRRRGEDPKELPYTKPEYQLYRKTVLEREDYKCEFCGALATDVHHEKSKKTDPMFALDPDYGHACCKRCHYKYGHKTGTECSTSNLAKKIC